MWTDCIRKMPRSDFASNLAGCVGDSVCGVGCLSGTETRKRPAKATTPSMTLVATERVRSMLDALARARRS